MTFPVSVDTSPVDEFYYVGLGKQNLDFPRALAELIDNSISSTLLRSETFTIEIAIEKEGDKIRILVADEGGGITLEDLRSKVLRLGGRGSVPGRMNEHGFGLKNGLCVLTENNRPFYILTRDEEAKNSDIYYLVKGPFRRGMQVELAERDKWLEMLSRVRDGTGTRVYAETTSNFFRTTYKLATRMGTLIERLAEHLGVFYRGYLQDRRNQIFIGWRDLDAGDSSIGRSETLVLPIEIPYTESEEDTIGCSFQGRTYNIKYKRGKLDSDSVEDPNRGPPYPLKIYYQNNIRTQGVDIQVRGRVLLPHQMEYIWPKIIRHGTLNDFVGELIIEDRDFGTVNNKTMLDPGSQLWEILREKMNDPNYEPPRTAGSRLHADMVRELKDKLENIVPQSQAFPRFRTWGGTGVEIDLLHRIRGRDEHIYEIKPRKATAKDVYQLVMYWDGRVEDGKRAALGRLVAEDAPTSVMQMIEYFNRREGADNEKYKLEFKKYSELVVATTGRRRRRP